MHGSWLAAEKDAARVVRVTSVWSRTGGLVVVFSLNLEAQSASQ